MCKTISEALPEMLIYSYKEKISNGEKKLADILRTKFSDSEIRDVTSFLYEIFGEAVEQFIQWGKLSKENLKNLKTIQEIFVLEEGLTIPLDEVLAGIIRFYRKFVPYNIHEASI